MVTFVKISDICYIALRLVSKMGRGGLARYMFANYILRSCDADISWSVEGGIGFVKLEGNQVMVSAILLALIVLIHTL